MGFLYNDGDSKEIGTSDKLDLVEFEGGLLRKFNDADILNIKYMAEEFGITFDKRRRESDVYLYNGEEEVVICPEPLEFIKEFDDVSDNTARADERFNEKIKTFHKIKLDKIPGFKGNSDYAERMWMNKTLTGINLRPGNLDDVRDKFDPIRMCDDNVHGLIAGRTGSGKSVFINALILSLITEYSPWELNLYLADFKKVELSRYMNNADSHNDFIAFTPHVNACAATSEIRYVTSLIKYLVDCMNARQEFFARLGVTKIQEFRNKYGLVLPRVLLIVDEFQQLFTEATSRETDEIQTMLNSITKLGRATGFHLIFASQEMSGTLRGNTLANFKIRMALPCNQQISSDILGNSQAVNLERGYVLVNTEAGDEHKNLKYRVPFIETDKRDDDDDDKKTPFYEFLDEVKLASRLFDLRYKTASQKFYREELQETEKNYLEDLDAIKDGKNKMIAASSALFDAVVLGKTVMYSPKPNDKVSFYIEKGRNKGIMIACPEPDNAARVRKLLAENLLRAEEETYHFGLEYNDLVWERYRMDDAVAMYKNHRFFKCDIDKGIEFFELCYHLRFQAERYMLTNTDILAELGREERSLCTILNDNEKGNASEEYRNKRDSLKKKLRDITMRIGERSKDAKNHPSSPIISFLEKCSDEIVCRPQSGTKVNFAELEVYKEINNTFASSLDIPGASQKSVGLIDHRIERLSKGLDGEDAKERERELLIVRNKMLRRAILFFTDRYEGVVPEKTSLSEVLERVYSKVEYSVLAYKKELPLAREEIKLLKEKEGIEAALRELDAQPDEIELAADKVLTKVQSFLNNVFDSAYTAVGYRKDRPKTPSASYALDGNRITWMLDPYVPDENTAIIANDILERFMKQCREPHNRCNFRKMVFWINGLDEIERIPKQMDEAIRNAINQNILVICIITSELRDASIRKAFDYAFITGNIEKFYTMFDIKYTKQPMDSIVVNFGIRSKGFDIPFKMYKSELEAVQTPSFIDELLNA